MKNSQKPHAEAGRERKNYISLPHVNIIRFIFK